MNTINYGLKEWAVAVKALEEGKTILLLRKGGIREQGKTFQVHHKQILLYPTYEHQLPHLLKSEYASLVTPVASGWHPEYITISSWAEITHILPVSDASVIASLLPYHIWNEQFISERLKFKPNQPVNLLLLRTYKLLSEVTLPYRSEYGGYWYMGICKSCWNFHRLLLR